MTYHLLQQLALKNYINYYIQVDFIEITYKNTKRIEFIIIYIYYCLNTGRKNFHEHLVYIMNILGFEFWVFHKFVFISFSCFIISEKCFF